MKNMKMRFNHNVAHIGHRGLKTPDKFIGLAALITFAMFMIFDPNPDLLLSICMSANVAIIFWALFRLYEWELLISPMALFFLGHGIFIYYTWGNLGARIAGEGRHGSNPGSLAYYPMAALLTTIGLLLFIWLVFFQFAHYTRRQKIRYKDLVWKPWQAPATIGVTGVLLLYLSLKYSFSSGYFDNVEGYFDRSLRAIQYFFIYLSVAISISVILRANNIKDRIIGYSSLILIALITIGMRSRTAMVQCVIIGLVCWITIQPKRYRITLLTGCVLAIAIFAIGTVVKTHEIHDKATTSIAGNIRIAQNTNLNKLSEQNKKSFQTDYQYRMAGLEHPAAILMCLDKGTSPMYGKGMYWGFLQGLPNILRPEGVYSEAAAIFENFHARGLKYDDSIGVALTSGLADWGLPGTLIYVFMAFYCLALWRVMQSSPRMFVAFLTMGAVITRLVWDGGLFMIKGVGFAWLILAVMSPILMPRWIPDSANTNSIYANPRKAGLKPRYKSPALRLKGKDFI